MERYRLNDLMKDTSEYWKLSACPNCKSEKGIIVHDESDSTYKVVCRICRFQTKRCDTLAYAVKIWNEDKNDVSP